MGRATVRSFLRRVGTPDASIARGCAGHHSHAASLAARTVAIKTTSDILRLLLTETCRRLRYSPKHTMLEPTARAMNCCPPDAKVIGEVLMVAFSGTRHNVFPSRSSTATT